MTKHSRTMLVTGAALLLGACTNKPIPDQYTGLSTYRLVQKVRCEAQHAIRTIVVDLIRREGKTDDQDDHIKQLAEHLENHLVSRTGSGAAFADVLKKWIDNAPASGKGLSKPVKDLINRYRQATIAYAFTFDITEKNNLNGSSNFLDVITGGTFKLGISAKNNQSRQNQRTLTIADNLEELVTKDIVIDGKDGYDCTAIDTGAGGIFYPIKGDLGLKDTFETYFGLDRYANLTAEKTDKNSSILTDTMTFTTELIGEVGPSIELSTGVANIRLGDASIGAEAVRKDKHVLEVALAMPPAKKLKPEKAPDPDKPAPTPEQARQTEKQAQARIALEALGNQRDRLFQLNVQILRE